MSKSNTGVFFTKRFLAGEFVTSLLVLLFVYTGCSKLLHLQDFTAAMAIQPLSNWLKTLLSATLPYAELVTAAGLLFYKTRLYALYLSALLLLLFTGYAGLAVFHYFKTTPCSCGGIIELLDWKEHFILNLCFLVLNIIAIALHLTDKRIVHNQEVS